MDHFNAATDILKSNRILNLIFWIFLMVFISCKEKPKRLFGSGDCGLYVAGKQGFWVGVYSDGLKTEDIAFRFENKKVIPQKMETGFNRIDFFIKIDLKLKDTLSLSYRKNDYKIYDFTNSEETAVDGTNHEKISICRVSTAKINGIKIKDANDNILKVSLDVKTFKR